MQGGGIFLNTNQNKNLSMKNCTFFDNLASSHGGAIYASVFNVHMINCTFEINRVESGRGGAVNFFVGDSSIDISLSEFSSNQIDGATNITSIGGAISIYGTNQ